MKFHRNNISNISIILQPEFSPAGLSAPATGHIYMYKVIKSELKGIFMKHVTNGQSNNSF